MGRRKQKAVTDDDHHRYHYITKWGWSYNELMISHQDHHMMNRQTALSPLSYSHLRKRNLTAKQARITNRNCWYIGRLPKTKISCSVCILLSCSSRAEIRTLCLVFWQTLCSGAVAGKTDPIPSNSISSRVASTSPTHKFVTYSLFGGKLD